MENRKIWIIGDSFTGSYPNAWIFKVCEQFIGEDYYVSSKGSRDTQTIIDIFLRKNFHHYQGFLIFPEFELLLNYTI